ncbi:MAG: threonine--tRNA ligase [Bacteroidota bacterium]
MVQIQFPDGAVRSYEKGITALGIAKSISEGLAKKVLAASVNGEVYDATRAILDGAKIMAMTAIDLWTNEALVAEMREAFGDGFVPEGVL